MRVADEYQPSINQTHQMEGPPQWSQNTTYHPGNAVWCAGTFWRCEVGHTSERGPSGAPTNTLHLWTPLSSNGYHPHQQQQQAQPSSSSQYPIRQDPKILSPTPRPMPSKPPRTELEELHKSGSDDSTSSDETITGKRSMDFFTGRAEESLRYHIMKEEGEKSGNVEELEMEVQGKKVWRVGGVGMWSYSMDPAEERVKSGLWNKLSRSHGRKDWLAAARARTAFYTGNSRNKPLIQWKLVEKGQGSPPDALAIGHETDGQLLYAARAWFNGGVHLGKAASRGAQNASLSWGGVEHLIDTYEILCGAPDPNLLKWMTFRHGEKCSVQGWIPVEGGREAAGEALLIAKGSYENGQHPGKCLIGDDHACVGWGGGEVWVRPFEVLAYSNPNRR